MSDEIEKHVLRRFELCQKLGEGVREIRVNSPLHERVLHAHSQQVGEILQQFD